MGIFILIIIENPDLTIFGVSIAGIAALATLLCSLMIMSQQHVKSINRRWMVTINIIT